MSGIVEDEDADDGVAAGWSNGPFAFLGKIFILSSVIALLVWWFILS